MALPRVESAATVRVESKASIGYTQGSSQRVGTHPPSAHIHILYACHPALFPSLRAPGYEPFRCFPAPML